MGTNRTVTKRRVVLAVVIGALATLATACPPQTPPGGGGGGTTTTTTPPPFEEFVPVPVITGLNQGLNIEFAPDGRVFIAEKSGVIKTYDSIEDPTATITADLRIPVRSSGDHGLLGLEVDPEYPTRPYVYILYTWDVTGLWGDGCAAGYTINGCLTGGRIARLEVDSNGVLVGAPTTIVDDRWCFQFTSHGVGDLEFMDDGTLLASAGEGAHVGGVDYGQYGGTSVFPPVANVTPRNVCDDPPNGVGGIVQSTTSEGGAFRSQDLLTEGDPVTWDGSIIRIDPDTGEAPADNPLVGIGSEDDDAVIAHGHRNPFRFKIRPGTDEVYIADVGRNHWEEINRTTVHDDVIENFGWPCREGAEPQPSWAALNNVMCELIYETDRISTLTEPWFTYSHYGGGGSLGGIEFVPTQGRYPESHEGALIYSDFVRAIVSTLRIGPDGQPDPAGPTIIAKDTITVDLEAGPDGFVYAVDYVNGTVNRLVHSDAAPVARIVADRTTGELPLTVVLDGSTSSDPDGGELTYEWDLDGDGEFDDGTDAIVTTTFTESDDVVVRLRVTDDSEMSSATSVTIRPGNTAPEVDIEVTSSLPWSANDDIDFEVTAVDAEDGVLDGSSVVWDALIYHCYSPEDCHQHPFTEGTGATGTFTGPSHGFPSYLVLRVAVTDSRGHTVTETVDLHPASATLELTSSPPGATVMVGEDTVVTPSTITVIHNDTLTISVPTPQDIGGTMYSFDSWSNGGAQSHEYLASEDATLHLTLTP